MITKTITMKRIVLASVFCLFLISVNAQCGISPFIQQNYEFDAKILVLREIQNNPNDPDYDNPNLSQSRIDGYLEQLSAMYNNPQNSVDIDSIFNEFQFHADPVDLQYHNMLFHVDTDASWVQTLKDTGTTGITDFDNILSQYQFSVSSFNDWTTAPYSGKTIFELESTLDFTNRYALRDDLQNATTEDLNFNLTFFNDDICGYEGIPYTIETYELPPQQASVVACDMYKNSSNDYWAFVLKDGCIFSNPNTQLRFITVSNDCNQVNFSRTLSTEEAELTNVSIFPNPASSVLNIQGITDIQTVEVHNIQGKKITISPNNFTQIDISSLQSGIYFLKVINDQNRSVIKKFIKK